MAHPVLTLRDIRLNRGGAPLLDGVDLLVAEGERLCLVGRNGVGKSTLLKIAAGLIEADDGVRTVHGGATVQYLAQEPDLSGYETSLAFAEAGLAPGDNRHRARSLLERLGLTGGENPAQLSGGEVRRCALARALAPEPDILLLDEPTNHLDVETIEWLEEELRRMSAAIVMVSHDRRFLETLSRVTMWLSRGAVYRLDRGFADFEQWRDDLVDQEERAQHKLDRRIAAETAWLRTGVRARRRRNQGRLRALQAMRKERRERRRGPGMVAFTDAETTASGKLVIDAADLSKSYDGRAIVEGLSLRVHRGDRVGIVGPNGAGKTTLLGLLTGILAPDSGTVRHGANLQPVTIEQSRESLDPNWTLADALTDGSGDLVTVGSQTRHVIGYMKDFLFPPEQARTPLTALSGGERSRLMLARALARPSNLLVLDEPTNDLDLETLDLLQELLAEHPGTILLVSHDRAFLDRVVTSVVVAEDGGRWIEYAGGYADMLAQRALGSEPAETARRAPRRKPGRAQASHRPSNDRPKLSFKEKHALETLPAQIDALQSEIETLRGRLAEPDFYARDPRAFTESADRLEQLERELADAEEAWLALEIRREEAEKRS